MPVPAAYTSLTPIRTDPSVESSFRSIESPKDLETALRAIAVLESIVQELDSALVLLSQHARQNREIDVRAIQDLQQTWNTFRTQYLADHP